MKINCHHGFFVFIESRAGEVSDFISLYDLDIIRKGDRFIFADLEDAPDYSIKGAPLLNTIAIKTFAGEPWEVLRENEMIYDFNTGLLVPLTSVTQTAKIDAAGNFYVSPGLILPGSLTDEGLRVTDYAAWFSTDTMKFKYSEVTSV
jgi:hypothetical protein